MDLEQAIITRRLDEILKQHKLWLIYVWSTCGLGYADLHGSGLIGADLSHADLRHSDLKPRTDRRAPSLPTERGP